jgi:hypothetical protein
MRCRLVCLFTVRCRHDRQRVQGDVRLGAPLLMPGPNERKPVQARPLHPAQSAAHSRNVYTAVASGVLGASFY